LIDDMRNIEADRVARTQADGIKALETEGPWDVLYLDHDLGFTDDGAEMTGYNVMCWLEVNPQFKPGRIEIVSSNPVGRRRMQTVIDKLYGTVS
jgi:hypothetical protein